MLKASKKLKMIHTIWKNKRYEISQNLKRKKQLELKMLAEYLFKGKRQSCMYICVYIFFPVIFPAIVTNFNNCIINKVRLKNFQTKNVITNVLPVVYFQTID